MALVFALPRWMVRAPRTAPPIVSHVVMVEPNISGLCAFNVRSAISTVERVPRILVPCDIKSPKPAGRCSHSFGGLQNGNSMPLNPRHSNAEFSYRRLGFQHRILPVHHAIPQSQNDAAFGVG